MTRTEAQNKASYKWLKEKTHRIALDYRNADYERVENAAKAAGLPVASFIRLAVDEKIERDAQK